MFLFPPCDGGPCHGVSHHENFTKKNLNPKKLLVEWVGTTSDDADGKFVSEKCMSGDGKFVSEKCMSAGAKCVSENSTKVGNVVRHRAVSTRSRRQEEL